MKMKLRLHSHISNFTYKLSYCSESIARLGRTTIRAATFATSFVRIPSLRSGILTTLFAHYAFPLFEVFACGEAFSQRRISSKISSIQQTSLHLDMYHKHVSILHSIPYPYRQFYKEVAAIPIPFQPQKPHTHYH